MKQNHSIAITGLSCKFPGEGGNPDSFWTSIRSGESAWSKVPRERFNIDGFWSGSKSRNTSVTHGAHFLKDDVSHFDANFFSIPKNEAEAMDPQQRIILEIAYEALERAGLPLDKIAGTKTGVFMGHFTSDYKEMLYRDPDSAPMYTLTGACKTSLANRISWLWDLRGPSFTLDTACSSSLVALHLACQSLRTGESDIAIVGGTSLLLNPEVFAYMSNQGFLSPDGKCKSFDESANGYGRGEGFGCLVLRRVDDAISAGDPIRAVIRGTGSNQDGHTKGLTLPNADAQASLIRETYSQAGVDMKDTSYVEAHGTGTQAGDLEEMEALSRTIAATHTADNKLLVGSVKSNIGHLEAAAGMAGIIKAILMLEDGLIPPNINFRKGNPKIKFDEWNIRVPLEATPWPTNGPRRVSVNSFGYGGTNAHAILEDANSYLRERNTAGNIYTKRPEDKTTIKSMNGYRGDMNGDTKRVNGTKNGVYEADEDRFSRLFVLSAQDKEGLTRLKKSLAKYVQNKASSLEKENKSTEAFLSELAFTLSERRSRLQWKTFVTASSVEELLDALNDTNSTALVGQSSQKPRLGFVFTGQGAQWPRMGIELMAHREFRESVMAADSYLSGECECPWSAITELERDKSSSQLGLAKFSQAICTVLQVALIDLMKSWKIYPTAVAGHSSGEIAAAYAMGALTREDAWKIAYYRGVLSSELKLTAPDLEGSMMAAGLSREKAEEWISNVTEGLVVVACVNSPSSVTLSGDSKGVDQLLGLLKDAGIFARKLLVDTAYHSPHMQAVAADYYELIADVSPLKTSGSCTMHSSVTGTSIGTSQLGPVNWVRNLTSPVLFSNAIHDMLRPIIGKRRTGENAVDLLVEIGPHSALRGPAIQTLEKNGIGVIPYFSAITRNESAFKTALDLAGALFVQGTLVDIRQVNKIDGFMHHEKPLIDLPSYPWNHTQKYWHESRVEKEYRSRSVPKLSLLGAPMPTFSAGERLWRGSMRLSEESWIADHKMQGSILYPGAGFLAMALEAASQTADRTRHIVSYKLRDIQLTSAAIINEGPGLEFIVQLRPHISGTRDQSSTWTEFVINSAGNGTSLVKNCSGLMIIDYEPEEDEDSCMKLERDHELKALRDQFQQAGKLCKNTIDPRIFYADLATIGLEYGQTFTNLVKIQTGGGQSLCTVQIPEVQSIIIKGNQRPHVVHPALLDAVFHLAFAAVKGSKSDLTTTTVPKFINEVVIAANVPFEPKSQLSGYSKSDRQDLKGLNSDIVMFDVENHLPVIEIRGLLCAEIAAASLSGVDSAASKSLVSKLTWKPSLDLLTPNEQQMALCEEEGVSALDKYIDLMHHSNPSMSILELIPTSSNLGHDIKSTRLIGIERILETATLTIGCQDPATSNALQEKPELHCGINFELLDISQPKSIENVEGKSYDIILTRYPDNDGSTPDSTLKIAARLLKRSGKLCLLVADPAMDEARTSLQDDAFGTTVIRNAVAAGSQELHMVLAQKIQHSTADSLLQKEVTLIQTTNPSEATKVVVSDVTRSLEDAGYTVATFVWGSNTSQLQNKSCISLLELEKPVFQCLSKQDFASIQSLILGANAVLWVTGFNDPSAFMIDGLARSVRNEMPGLSFRTLHTTEHYTSVVQGFGNLIGRVFASTSVDDEFLFKDNLLHVSRVEVDEALDEQITAALPGAQKPVVSMPLGQTRSSMKLCIKNPGMFDSFYLEPDHLPSTELEHDFIEIHVKASALGARDIMAATGQIASSDFGLNAAGVVRRLGSSVSKFKLGDRVVIYGHGSHRMVHRSRADHCALIPDTVSFEQAATIPTAHCTAWNAIVRLAKVQKGQSILIHSAASGVGQAAVQLAKYYGMEIFITVSSEDGRKLLRDEYGIPADHTFSSRNLGFVKGIKRMTKNRGVDVILNSLSGEMLRQTWHCIAPFGYFIDIGLKDIVGNTGLDMLPYMQNATFSFFNLDQVASDRPEIMSTIVEGVFDFQRRGITRPIQTIASFSISEIENAYRTAQAGLDSGDIVVTWGEEDVVPVIQQNNNVPELNPDGAYVLVGGLGGLGRSLSIKLADLGARKLCFLSRSGNESTGAKQLIHELEKRGIQIQVLKCDVSDQKALAIAANRCESELGTVRGVFQCAMVLRDTLFMNMDYQQWVESTRPKVQGSWNLHKQFPDVDFFIMLSSFAAIFGNRGQSNYAAAGAYEDALAHHRRAIGQRAVTLDLGLMRDIGVLAETGITDSLREWEEPYGIREPEFLALMERAISGGIAGTISPQVLTGLATGGSAVAAGIKAPYYLENARFSIMARTGDLGENTSVIEASVAPHVLISQATSLEEAGGIVLKALVDLVAKMLQTTPSEIDPNRFLYSCGVDSLVAIEIINWALKEVKTVVTVFEVLAGVPMITLCNQMAAKSTALSKEIVPL